MAKNYQRLWKEVTSTIDEAKSVRILAEILVDKEGRTFVSRLGREDAELCIEILDHGIAVHNLKTAEKQAFFVTLRRLSGYYGRLPDSMIITEKIEVEDKVLASGGFADVRRGTYMGHLVAVKSLRVAEQDDFVTIRKRFCKEAVLWGTVSHPNVLKFTGVHGDMEKRQFVTVSEWMAHGNIMDFIRNNHVNRLELLCGAAQGLEYLHGASLTHGDLKGANILMSNDTPPRACLADFGFMTMVLDPGQKLSCSAQLEGGTMTFMSPELLMPSHFGIRDSVPTPEADVYAFGLVIFQVLAGEIPFRGVRQTELGWSVVHDGLRPTKPENAPSIGFSDPLWDFIERCWGGDMKLRPRVAEVVRRLEREAANWVGLMPPCAPVENIVSDSEGPPSDTLEHCGIFPSKNVDLESLTDSSATSGIFSSPNTPSTGCSDLPQEGPLAVVTKPSGGAQSVPRAGTEIRPSPESGVPMRPQFEEPHDDLHVPEMYTHLGQSYKSPPSKLPEKKRRGFKRFKSKFRELFGLGVKR